MHRQHLPPFLRRISLIFIWSLPWLATAQAPSPDGAMMKKEMGDILDSGHDPAICAPDGVAVGGYDLVSYHTSDGPVMGVQEFSSALGEFTYLFSSQENLRAFEDDPERYLPRYSGWCAISLALGRLTCPDYRNFQIEEGQLLLFETTGFTDGRVVWNVDRIGNRRKADDNYAIITRAE